MSKSKAKGAKSARLVRNAKTANTCKATASSGHLVCVLDSNHGGAHSTAAPGKGKPMQHAAWVANAAGQVIVTTFSHGKRQSEWTEPAPIEPVPVDEGAASKMDAARSLVGKRVRFNHQQDRPESHAVTLATDGGLVELDGMPGLFAPHLFTVCPDALPAAPDEDDPRPTWLREKTEQRLKEERYDLVRVGDAQGPGTWCVVTKRGRDPQGKIKDNYADTACGDRVYATTADVDYLVAAPLLPPRAPGSGLRSVQCPIKTARKVELAEATLCTSCAFAINPHVEDDASKEKRKIAERDAVMFTPEAIAAARDISSTTTEPATPRKVKATKTAKGLAVCPAKWEHARACELHAGHVGAHVAHLSGSGRGLMTWETGTDDPNHWECCSVRRAGVRCDRPAEHDGSHLALHPHQGEQHLCQWNDGEPGANDVSVGSLELLYKRPIDVALALEKNFVEPEARRSPLTLEDDPEDDEPSEVAIAALDQEDEHDPFAPSATSPAATSSPTTSGEPVDDGKLIAPTGATITCGGRVYPTHPMARIFPTPEKQYRDIVASIRLHGLQKEIELLDEPGNPVIDGCSRLRACEELGITPRTKVIHVEDKLAYVKAVNLDRRHLDESRRAIAAAGLATIAHGSNQHTRGPADMPVMTQAQAAEAMGVSERMVRDVVRVNNAGASAVVEAMNSGRLKVSAAAEFLKDNLGKSKQSEIFEKVTKGNGEVRPGKVRSLVKQEMKRELISKINTGRVAPMPMGPFGVIYGDYPWLYGNSDQHEGSRGHNGYPAMPMDDIIAHAIEARKRAAEDCVLALWFTNAFLREVGRVVDAYGAVQHTAWTWDKCTEKNDKDKKGVGTWGRGRTEHLVIASIGNPVHTLNEVDTLIRAAVRGHSQKPEVFAELLGKHCSGPFLEMFARDPREGWTTWGAEAEGSKATEVKPKKKSKILTATDRQMRGSAA